MLAFFGFGGTDREERTEAPPKAPSMLESLLGAPATPSTERDTLAALHHRFRADLESAPLDDLRRAANEAAALSANDDSAGGWRLDAAARLATAPEALRKAPDDADGGWVPFSPVQQRWRPYTDASPTPPRAAVDGKRWGELRVFPSDDAQAPSRWRVSNADADGFDEIDQVVREGALRNCVVGFLDGSYVSVGVARHDRGSDVLNAIAARLGIGPRASGALALYAGRADAARGRSRLERRVPPHAAMLPLCDDQRVALVLAVRLFTAPLHDAALRALRGVDASREDQAVGRLVLAQTTAQVMRRGYARLPRLVARAPSRASSSSSFALSPLSQNLSDSDSDSDDDGVDGWGSVAAAGKLAAPTRLRLGALRLWSRARDLTSRNGGDEVEACHMLVRDQGLAPFCPQPHPSRSELLEEVTQLLMSRLDYGDSDDATAHSELELDGADTPQDTPEASYVELMARSPFHGATLFGGVDDARLAISRRGCVVLTGDGALRELDVPLEACRRWRVRGPSLHVDREAPIQKWPLEQARVARDPAAPCDESWFSPSQKRPSIKSPKPPPVSSYICEVDAGQGAPGGASEACSLLDDYALCDLAESPPQFGWESPDARGRCASDRTNERRRAERAGLSREEALLEEQSATMLLGGFYNALVAAVVRPPRFEYDPRLLGPSSFNFGGRRYHRHDVVIENDRGLRLHGSHWRSCDEDVVPCVVFGHANSASRAQACHYLSLVLGLGCSLFAFDCAGSGLSDGAFVTLGFREARDMRCVLAWLARRDDVSALALWGQSMGAAAALYYQGFAASEEGVWPALACVVLDSPYSDFSALAKHVASERKAAFGGFTLPTFVLDLLLASLDASVDARAGLRPTRDLSPINHAAQCEAPVLFVRARRDPLISQEHVEALAKRYKGPRTLALVEGSHSSPRDVDARRFVARFLARHLPLPPLAKRPPSETCERHLQCAPWSRVRTEFATPLKARSQSMPPLKSPDSLDSIPDRYATREASPEPLYAAGS
jgi:pimeloyl-ACP methyl ester carboxylesterase